MSEFVYFLHNPETGLTKIGKSIDPHKRKVQLESEYGVKLKVVAVGETNDCTKLEKETHAYFKSLHVGREWFKLDNPLAVARDTLADALLDWSEVVRTKPKRVKISDDGHTPIRAIKITDSLWDAIPNTNKSEYVRQALEEKLKKEGKR